MTTWFISRHPAAIEWALHQGISVDQQAAHLDIFMIQVGDVVIGSLPVNLAADVCKRGARYIHLSLDLPADMRGRELTVEDMDACHARLEEYRVTRVEAES